MTDEMVGIVAPCKWRDGGISIDTPHGLFMSPVWSPSGKFIAFATQNEGVWLLDLSDYIFRHIPSISYQLPIWGENDDTVFLNSTDGLHKIERSGGQWRETVHEPGFGNMLWSERVDPSGCLGVVRYLNTNWHHHTPDEEHHYRIILHANYSMDLASVKVIHPCLSDGHPLSIDQTEAPVWWVSGESALVVACRHGMPSNYIVDIATGLAVEWKLPNGVLRRLSTSTDPHLIAGTIGNWRDNSVQDVIILVDNEGKVLDTVQTPGLCIYHSLALSPDARRIAMVERDLTISIVPIAEG